MRETLEPHADLGPTPPFFAPGGIFHNVGTQTHAGEIVERFRCLCGLAFVISLPESTSRADESSVGGETGRSVTSAAGPLRFSPAELTVHTRRNQRPRIK